MTKLLQSIIRISNFISEWSGRLLSWLIGLLVLLLVYETIMRFFFKTNIPWVYDVSYMLGGSAIAIGAAMALKNGKHVRVDIFTQKISDRNRAVLDIALGLFVFIPVMYIAVIYSFDSAYVSWVRKEHIMSGNWRPPIYPLKMIIPIAFILLIIQGVAEISKNILILMKRGDEHGS